MTKISLIVLPLAQIFSDEANQRLRWLFGLALLPHIAVLRTQYVTPVRWYPKLL